MRLLDRQLRWETYREFFHITILRYLVLWFTLVPLLASALSGLKTPVKFELSGEAHSIALELPFSWQVLWMSSFFFFIALVIYQLRCPAFVKKYHSFSHYVAYQHDSRWLAYEVRALVESGADTGKFTATLLTKGFARRIDSMPSASEDNPSIESTQTVYRYMQVSGAIELGMPIRDAHGRVIDDSERGLFWEVFATYSGSRQWERLAIVVLLVLSAICFSFVLTQHVLQGVEYVWAWAVSVL